MRPTLVFSFIFTILVEGGVAYLGELGRHGDKPKPRRDESAIVLVEMPKIDPDPVEEVDELKQETSSPDIAPPMQPDFPQCPTPDAFIQPIEPPSPTGAKVLDSAFIFSASHGKGDGIGVFDLSSLDRAPEVTHQSRPSYPAALRREGVIGEVELEFIVDTDGNVRNVRVVTASRPEFEQAAIDAVYNWRFRPGRKEGHAVNVHMAESIVFTLDT